MKRTFIIIAALAANTYAGSGTTAANFLKFAVSAREAGLAGAYTALCDESSAIFSNPAGLNRIKGKELSFGFASYLQDSRIGILSYASDYKGSRVGLGLSAYSIDGIERRGLNDISGVMGASGSFSATDMAFYLAYAKPDAAASFIDNTDFGINVKLINSKIDDSSAFGAAADIGFVNRYSEEMNISLVLANLGTEMKYESESDPLPLNLRAGISYRIKRTQFACEMSEYFREDKFYPSLAAEHELRDGFTIRAGYKFGYDTGNLGSYAGLSAGFGIKTSGIGLDYTYSPFGELGDIHRFDFKIRF
ncbi:MAG: type IX secretion system protein PorQ [Elusimicrobiota bacterium]